MIGRESYRVLWDCIRLVDFHVFQLDKYFCRFQAVLDDVVDVERGSGTSASIASKCKCKATLYGSKFVEISLVSLVQNSKISRAKARLI